MFGILLSTVIPGWEILLLSRSWWRAFMPRQSFIQACSSYQVRLLSWIWFLAYLESYLYIEEEIDQADVDKYDKMTPGFMDYDVSNIFRNIKNIIYSFISLWFSVIFWQLIYFLLLPFLMFREMGTTFMVSFKRDIGGFCLKNNSTAPGDEGKMAKEYCEVLVSCSNLKIKKVD